MENIKKTKNFFCRKCLTSYIIPTEYKNEIVNLTENIKIDQHLNFTYKCCKCGHDAEEIDEKMFYNVIKLNKMGFYTDYCCEGHSEDDKNMDSGTYIKFLSFDERFCDDFRKMDEEKHLYLKSFLEREIRNHPLLNFEISKYDHSISIDMNYNSDEFDRYIDDKGFEYVKTETLSQFDELIKKLEKQITREEKMKNYKKGNY